MRRAARGPPQPAPDPGPRLQRVAPAALDAGRRRSNASKAASGHGRRSGAASWDVAPRGRGDRGDVADLDSLGVRRGHGRGNDDRRGFGGSIAPGCPPGGRRLAEAGGEGERLETLLRVRVEPEEEDPVEAAIELGPEARNPRRRQVGGLDELAEGRRRAGQPAGQGLEGDDGEPEGIGLRPSRRTPNDLGVEEGERAKGRLRGGQDGFRAGGLLEPDDPEVGELRARQTAAPGAQDSGAVVRFEVFDEARAGFSAEPPACPPSAAFFGRPAALAARVVLAAGFGAASAGASARADLLRASRAFSAAVWAPFPRLAFAAAIRAFAAFAAAAVPVVFAVRAAVWTTSPARAAFTFLARRDLRRAAAFGWIAPTFAARSRALTASAKAAIGSAPSGFVVAIVRAFLTSVFAALRRGWRMAWRRREARTRLRADGVRAPLHLRGVLAKGYLAPAGSDSDRIRLMDALGCPSGGESGETPSGATGDGSRVGRNASRAEAASGPAAVR